MAEGAAHRNPRHGRRGHRRPLGRGCHRSAARADRPRARPNVTLYSQTNGFIAIRQHSTDFLLIVGLGLAALAFSTEFSAGTVRNVLVREPRRLHLFAGKAVVIFALIAGWVVLVYAAAWPAAYITAPHYGVSTTAWMTRR